MLSKLTIAAAIVTLTGYSTDASAAVPSFSGTYLFQSEETCPATLIVTQNKTGDITNIVTGTAGDLNIDNFAVTLTPAAGKPNNGKIVGKGYQTEIGGLLRGPGQTFSNDSKAVSVIGTYSNTATSFTVTGNMNLSVVYGTIKAGIVQTAILSGLTTFTSGSPKVTVTCAQHATLTHT